MSKITWSKDLDTGISVIDRQHRRIVDYINELDDARTSGHKKEDVAKVIDDLVDYTLSHFAFEESLQEQADYPFIEAHRKVHGMFVRRVARYQERFELGDDIVDELQKTLVVWLVNHIKHDDADYVSAVKRNLDKVPAEKMGGWLSRFFK